MQIIIYLSSHSSEEFDTLIGDVESFAPNNIYASSSHDT